MFQYVWQHKEHGPEAQPGGWKRRRKTLPPPHIKSRRPVLLRFSPLSLFLSTRRRRRRPSSTCPTRQMEGAAAAAAAADDLALKGVADQYMLPMVQKEKGRYKDGEDEEAAVHKEEEDDDMMLSLLFGDDQTKEVTGWNAQTWTTIRQEQSINQEKKSETSAAKKGLGFFCYGSHGAYKPKST